MSRPSSASGQLSDARLIRRAADFSPPGAARAEARGSSRCALRSATAITTIACLVSALLPAGCSKQPPAQPTPTPRNVVLIIIDTLRADKLGCYGSQLGATPRIDELAASGVRFERAYSHAPWTLPACASILTSLYPPQHGAGGQVPNFRKLPDSARTVAECFQDAGFATAAIINVDFLTESFGMTQGFQEVDFKVYPTNIQVRPAEPTTDAALNWLESRGARPFFLMVHYFDPHLVYAPPPAYRRIFAAPQDRENASWVFGTRGQIIAYRKGTLQFDDDTIRRAERLYDGEVAYTDHQVGRLLDGLDRLGLTNSTIVALTADHGEEFLDHGGFEHGHTLYEELVHVPLIIRTGPSAGGRTVPTVVGHVDLPPTLCQLGGVAPDPAFAGSSLVDLLDGMDQDDRPIIFQGNFWGPPLQGWLQGGYKLILHTDQAPQLFDLTADPSERSNRRELEPQRASQMTADLELAFKGMTAHLRGEESPAKLSPDELRRLEALGYITDE